jgi:hypothetical protein
MIPASHAAAEHSQPGVWSAGPRSQPGSTPGTTLTLPQILETKVRKLEQLVKLKDAKIHTLMAKLQAAGLL